MRYFVYQDVLDELGFAASYEGDVPLVGLLIGQFGLEERGPFLEITGFDAISARDAAEGALFKQLRRALDERFGTERDPRPLIGADKECPAGFFIHQPGQGLGLSDELLHVHLSMFNLPYQVILMMDQPADLCCLYARPPQGAFFDASFYVVSRRLTPQPTTSADAS